VPRLSIHDAKYRRLLARLREAREAAGLDQIEVSRRLRKPLNYCNRLESGERRLQVLDLGDLARLYGKPLRYFMPDTPPENG
jgi:transcriptional regulator with XRE-family HTH domain